MKGIRTVVDNESPTPPISSPGADHAADELLRSGAIASPDAPGTLGRIDRFKIVKVLGEGGMGQVLLAHEPITGTYVAIKVLHPRLVRDAGIVHRFLIEARHMYRMSHPAVVKVTEVSDRKEGPYYVMPYLEGGSLVARIDPAKPMPRDEVLQIARQVAEALQYAHEKGIIHRDLKPGNVLLDREGSAFLTDFGLLRTVFNDSMVDVRDSQVEGTAPYLSPATAAGKAEDTRCDIYAFGALLYEMLAHQPPYTGATAQAILNQIAAGPPEPILKRNPKAPLPLVQIADWAMARELRNRYATMADVVSDLNRVAGNKPPLGPHPQRRWRGIVALTAGVLATAALTGAVLYRFQSSLEQGDKPGGPLEQRSGVAAGGARASTDPVGSAASGVAQETGDDASATTAQDEFVYSTNNDAISVVKYTGSGGAVVIPDTIHGFPVTEIANDAFHRHTNLTSVVIPNGVTSIRKSLFDGCRALTSVTLPDSVTSIEDFAFKFCGNLTNVTIPNRVARIGTSAFHGCASLSGVTIPSSVISIGSVVFSGCIKLTSITVDAKNPVYSSDDGVLFNKEKTCLISCPGGKEGRYTVPGGVIGIGPLAFHGSTSLTSITIPASVESISPSAFSSCMGLIFITVDMANAAYSSDDGVLFNKEKTALVCCPSRRYGSYAIPDGVTSVGNSAFAGCKGLVRLIVPAGVTTIGGGAFQGCLGLTSVCFEGHAPALGPSAFLGTGKAIVYYRAGTTGWDKEFGGRPTALWASTTGGVATDGGQDP